MSFLAAGQSWLEGNFNPWNFILSIFISSRFDQPQFAYQPESLPPQELVNNKQRSPAARANSMPPRASRPQVLKKIGDAQESYKIGDAKETYSINGVNYTTYTTFR